MAKPPVERPVVSTTQASEMLGVSDETIKRYLFAGTLKGFKLPSGQYRIFVDSIEALTGTP